MTQKEKLTAQIEELQALKDAAKENAENIYQQNPLREFTRGTLNGITIVLEEIAVRLNKKTKELENV